MRAKSRRVCERSEPGWQKSFWGDNYARLLPSFFTLARVDNPSGPGNAIGATDTTGPLGQVYVA